MTRVPFLLIATTCLSACFPDFKSPEIQQEIAQGWSSFARGEVYYMVGAIELHKLRNGVYPDSLTQVDVSGALDPAVGKGFYYAKLDTGYHLDYIKRWPLFNGKRDTVLTIELAPDYWRGLGCQESNMK